MSERSCSVKSTFVAVKTLASSEWAAIANAGAWETNLTTAELFPALHNCQFLLKFVQKPKRYRDYLNKMLHKYIVE